MCTRERCWWVPGRLWEALAHGGGVGTSSSHRPPDCSATMPPPLHSQVQTERGGRDLRHSLTTRCVTEASGECYERTDVVRAWWWLVERVVICVVCSPPPATKWRPGDYLRSAAHRHAGPPTALALGQSSSTYTSRRAACVRVLRGSSRPTRAYSKWCLGRSSQACWERCWRRMMEAVGW